MSVTVGGSTPQLTFADATVQNTAALPLTGGSVSADITVNGLTVGRGAGAVATNTAVGYQAGYSNTTGAYNTYIGLQAGYTANGDSNVVIGWFAGKYITTGTGNTLVGTAAGNQLTTGIQNTFVGPNTGSDAAGYSVTTGSKNTIIGGYSGNQGGLDIRTSNNYIVLSDGDGNPRGYFTGAGLFTINAASNPGYRLYQESDQTAYYNVGIKNTSSANNGVFIGFINSAGAAAGNIQQTGATSVNYGSGSDYRLKENITDVINGLDIICTLRPVNFDWVADKKADTSFIAHEIQAVIPNTVVGEKDAVDKDGNPIYQMVDKSGVIPFLVAAIKELKAEFDAYKATHP